MSATASARQRAPEITVDSYTESKMVFKLQNTDASVANALRRVMIAEVPTLAIDQVRIHDNTSCLPDEFLAHRLGLIPLHYRYRANGLPDIPEDAKSSPHYRAFDGDLQLRFCTNRKCPCDEHCHRCSATFELDVDYDRDDKLRDPVEHDTPMIVTTRDLRETDSLKNSEYSGDVMPVDFASVEEREQSQDKGIQIVRLAKGQRIHCVCVAFIGIAKEHHKWSPVATATYRYEPIITLNHQALATLTDAQRREIVDSSPDKLLALDADGRLEVTDPDKCTFSGEEEATALAMKVNVSDDDFLSIKHDESKFVFTVEGTGALPVGEVVIGALRVINSKIRALQQEVLDLGKGGAGADTGMVF